MKRKMNRTSENDPLLAQPEKLFSALLDRYRYSALGSLVRGITHNLNGALQILSMQMELLQGALRKEGDRINPSLNAKLGQCLEQLDKLKALIKILIQKGTHDDQEGPQLLSLNDLLEEELSLLHHNLFFKHHIKVVQSFSRPLPLLRGTYHDFNQGLANLLQNAVEAMEESPVKELVVATFVRDDEIHVMIRDTGCGIPEEIKADLFKPFRTTKGGGHHGLGLFIARQLLTPYGAIFSFSSRQGETTCKVRFPISPARGK